MAQVRRSARLSARLRAAAVLCGVIAAGTGVDTAAAQGNPYGGVMPAGHHQTSHGPSFAGPAFAGGAYAGPQYGSPEHVFAGPCHDDAYVTRKMIPDPQGQYGPRPNLLANRPFGGMRARVEYRYYRLTDPGAAPVGAPQLPGEFDEFFNITTPTDAVNDTAEAFNTGGFNFDGVNAIAAVLAFDTAYGTLEVDGFATDQATASRTSRTRLTPVVIDPVTQLTELQLVRPSIPLLNEGTINNTLAIPLDEISFEQTVEFFGTGATWILPPLTPNVPVTTSLTVGGRYFQYAEHFNVNGQFTLEDDSAVDPVTGEGNVELLVANPRINSRAINHVFGPAIGIRFDAPGRWVSLGVEPRFGFGISRRVERVRHVDLLTPTVGLDADEDGGATVNPDDVVRTRTNEESDLAPFVELNAYGRVHLRENFSLFAGYNLVALTRMSTAARQLEFTSDGDRALVNLDQDTRTIVVHGLMVGGEWVFGR